MNDFTEKEQNFCGKSNPLKELLMP